MKACADCGTIKSLEDFYVVKRKGRKDALSSYCKACDLGRCRKYQKSAPGKLSKKTSDEKYRSSRAGKKTRLKGYLIQKKKRRTEEGRKKRALEAKKYRATPVGKIICKRSVKAWKLKNAIKYKAQKMAQYHHPTLKPCIVCGSKRTHRHHPDYSKPKNIVFLCHLHHKLVHKREVSI